MAGVTQPKAIIAIIGLVMTKNIMLRECGLEGDIGTPTAVIMLKYIVVARRFNLIFVKPAQKHPIAATAQQVVADVVARRITHHDQRGSIGSIMISRPITPTIVVNATTKIGDIGLNGVI